jgi:FkbM family methyltransferase
MIPGVKRRAKHLLQHMGLDLMRIQAPGWYPYYLERLGFRPRTIVDVGVGWGTKALYRTYPQAYFALVEPLIEFEPRLREILRRYRGEYLLTALGAAEGEQTIRIDAGWHERSSLLRRTPLEDQGNRSIERRVPVTTLDTLLAGRAWQPPFGLKLDVEGFELAVVEGAGQFLRQTEFVIAEVATARRFEGGYTMVEFLGAMEERSFCLREILDAGRNNDSELIFLDMVFARR